MTDLQLVKETVKYYTEDINRKATDGDSGMCEYKTSDGKQCAIGRLIDENKLIGNGFTWEELNEKGSLDGGLEPYLRNNAVSICDILKDEYKEITYECLCDLQDFHDLVSASASCINRGKELILRYEA